MGVTKPTLRCNIRLRWYCRYISGITDVPEKLLPTEPGWAAEPSREADSPVSVPFREQCPHKSVHTQCCGPTVDGRDTMPFQRTDKAPICRPAPYRAPCSSSDYQLQTRQWARDTGTRTALPVVSKHDGGGSDVGGDEGQGRGGALSIWIKSVSCSQWHSGLQGMEGAPEDAGDC